MKTLVPYLILFMFSAAISGKLLAQPAIQWDRTIGGSGNDFLYAAVRTPDGGYLLGGSSDSNISGEKSENSNGSKIWLVKTNSTGIKEWDKTIGIGDTGIGLRKLLLTSDGGYLLGGVITDDDVNVVIKIDKNGVRQWLRRYARGKTTDFEAMEKAPDGGYILGFTSLLDESQSQGPIKGYDYWIVKIDVNGRTQWEKVYGGAGSDQLESLQATSDKGYIVAGASNSGKGGDKSDPAKGYGDFWILKLDPSGNKQWDKTIGGPGGDGHAQISQTPDGGYIVGGITSGTAGGDKSENSNGADYWAVKLSATGQVQWDQDLSGKDYTEGADGESFSVIIQTADGGYLIGGTSDSAAGIDKSEEGKDFESIDLWVVKLAADGTKEWDKTVGSGDWNHLQSIVQAPDGGYLLATSSENGIHGDKTQDSRGGSDFWIIKLAPENVPSPQTLVRINAGGPDFTTATKKLFIADQYYSDAFNVTSSIPSGDILNTTNDVLYRTARNSPYCFYEIPVKNIQVNVTLHFAETYYGTPGKGGGAGSRRFNVDIEGKRVLTNYDIFAAAGGAMRAVQITIPVTVADGILDINFGTGAAGQPSICAIEVVSTNYTLGPLADAYVRDGNFSTTNFNGSSLDIKSTSGDPSANRSSYLKFKVPQALTIAAAKLRIYGHNHEDTKSISVHAYGVNNDSWTEGSIVKNNAPAASTASLGYASVNNVYKYYEIDVTSYVKAQQQSGDEIVSLLLRDPSNRNTRMVFNSKEAISKPPQLIIQNVANSTARLSQEEATFEQQEKELSVVFPNPATDEFTVLISRQHAGNISFQLVNNAGESNPIQAAERVRPGEKVRFDVDKIPVNAGIYLLKVDSEGFSEVVKLLIAK
ncbi:CBM96 family carbohydrate-binding protein [Dyadobacter sandarakinus]|uniref:DNRLRE domain-containing protein n=1 Tax=Dyadobacter sandarakinus TaxID=2747268 RepID=A0ABX7I5Q4_9BACT|nr:DNRLRE domain-containing protein [Dyadobacter sandarakinus]QRR01429.1 DNRLRE domain-containing protein [Dyadobacter sandarakinus]